VEPSRAQARLLGRSTDAVAEDRAAPIALITNHYEFKPHRAMPQIVLITTEWGPSQGGINSFNSDFARALSQVLAPRVRVTCVVMDATAKEKEEAAEQGVALLSVGMKKGAQVDEFLALNILNAVQREQPHEVLWWVGHDVISGGATIALPALAKQGKSAVIHHMSYIDYSAYKHGGDGTQAKDKQREQRRVFEQAHKVFAVGPLLRDKLTDLLDGSKPVQTIIPGLAQIKPALNPKTFNAITFGRLDPENDRIKQGRLAIASFATACRKAKAGGFYAQALQNNPRLIVIGIAPDSTEINDLHSICHQKAERAVNLIALPYEKNREELFDELRRSSLAMMLSLHEGFGLTGWEAIAAEVPLIVSMNSGLYQLIDEELAGSGTGCLKVVDVRGGPGIFTQESLDNFHNEDEEDVSEAILDVASNSEKWKRNASNLRRLLLTHKGGFTWQNAAQKFAQALELLNESASDIALSETQSALFAQSGTSPPSPPLAIESSPHFRESESSAEQSAAAESSKNNSPTGTQKLGDDSRSETSQPIHGVPDISQTREVPQSEEESPQNRNAHHSEKQSHFDTKTSQSTETALEIPVRFAILSKQMDDGKFRPVQVGQGMYANIFRGIETVSPNMDGAEQIEINCPVVVKIFKDHAPTDFKVVFEDEVKALLMLGHHENIVELRGLVDNLPPSFVCSDCGLVFQRKHCPRCPDTAPAELENDPEHSGMLACTINSTHRFSMSHQEHLQEMSASRPCGCRGACEVINFLFRPCILLEELHIDLREFVKLNHELAREVRGYSIAASGARKSSSGRREAFLANLSVLIKVSEALAHMHDRNLLHGALSPGKVMIRLAEMLPYSLAQLRFGSTKLVGFGQARVDRDLNIEGVVFGRSNFLAVENTTVKHRLPEPACLLADNEAFLPGATCVMYLPSGLPEKLVQGDFLRDDAGGEYVVTEVFSDVPEGNDKAGSMSLGTAYCRLKVLIPPVRDSSSEGLMSSISVSVSWVIGIPSDIYSLGCLTLWLVTGGNHALLSRVTALARVATYDRIPVNEVLSNRYLPRDFLSDLRNAIDLPDTRHDDWVRNKVLHVVMSCLVRGATAYCIDRIAGEGAALKAAKDLNEAYAELFCIQRLDARAAEWNAPPGSK
jgi:glycosyltransferase involved in cell wall biosynthesis/serine/threonine protein kinase